ncbi:tyrosine-protein kinase SRK3-like isoform X2 [Ptychodera flava]|uniref:tyrosine-protein kinase SRK3-like isoform X2 n=1 Tax=Ptychodera flava TaxID=63121 RepID=UPI00396A428E
MYEKAQHHCCEILYVEGKMSYIDKRTCDDGINAIVLTSYIEERSENLEHDDRCLLQEARDAVLKESKSVLKNCTVTLLGKKVKVEFKSGEGENKCCVHLDGSNQPKSYWQTRIDLDAESTLSDDQQDYDDYEDVPSLSLDENIITNIDLSEAEPESRIPVIDKDAISRRWKLLNDEFAVYYEGMLEGDRRVMIKQSKDDNCQNIERIQTEASILWDLDHNNVVKLHGIGEDPVCLITEFLENGTLTQFLIENEKRLKLSDAMKMASQCASAISYVASKGYVHRDIGTRSVLVGSDRVCKLAGFTLAAKLENGIYDAKGNNTIALKWAAPETFTSQTFSPKSDVWAFGILLLEIVLHGKVPYQGLTGPEVTKLVDSGCIPTRPKKCPLELYLVMQQCWEKDPEDRPSADDVKQRLVTLKLE